MGSGSEFQLVGAVKENVLQPYFFNYRSMRYFLTKRFIRATDSRNKHKKMKKNATFGNGFKGLPFLGCIPPIESMKDAPKSSSPIIITKTRRIEWCTVWKPVYNNRGRENQELANPVNW